MIDGNVCCCGIFFLILMLSLFYFSDKHISLIYYRDNLRMRLVCYVLGDTEGMEMVLLYD